MAVRVEAGAAPGVGVLTLDRTERANAYDRAHLRALLEGYRALAAEHAVVVVQAAGDGAFCAGADLAEVGAAHPEDALDLESQRVFTEIARGPATTVAAVHGPAVAGGFELALACDLRVAGPRARFSLPETSLGLVPSAGGLTRLVRMVGPSVARAVVLAGREIDADEALGLGLVLEVAPDPRAAALDLARRLARRPATAMRLARGILDLGESEASLRLERVSEALLYALRRRREE